MRRWLTRTPPPVVLSTGYLVMILIGAGLLLLPASTTAPITVLDALFTATSSVTVAGLSVVDTAIGLTFWGQLVVLVLMQLGGLGIMAFGVLILMALGQPLGLEYQTFLREDLNQTSYRNLRRLAVTILRVTLIAELAGAAALWFVFAPDTGGLAAIWHAAFHAVSAFNNAGISTLPGGLARYATDPVINLVIPALFISGGIGCIVIWDIRNRRFWHGWTLHSRLMIVGTAVLIVVGVTLTAVLEWNNPNTLGGFDSAGQRLMVAWFHGVAPRTAGFNTVDVAAFRVPTALLIMALMIVGGGPTSTAGGLKVTTVFVLFLAALAFFRRRTHISVFGRSIGMDEVLKVTALIALSGMIMFTGVFLMTIVEDRPLIDIGFEVTAALSTAGMTRGYTPEMGDAGRVIIMALMFIGRVGPLTLGFFLAARVPSRVRYPEGQVHLG